VLSGYAQSSGLRHINIMQKTMQTIRLVYRALLIALIIGALSFAQQPAAQQPQQPATQPDTLDALRERLAAHLSQPRFAAVSWGVKIVSLDTGVAVFEHNADKYFNPASNAKLYTAALALDRLGGDFRMKTSIYAATRADEAGAIKGDLIIYGRGDPSFAARWNGGDYYKGMDRIVSALESAGVKSIEGDLVGDESYFTGPPYGSGWEWDDLQWYYGAAATALSINDNSVDLFVTPAERAGIPCRITTGPQTSFVTIMNRTRTVAKGATSRISVYRPVGENIIYVSGSLAVGDRGFTGYVAVHNPSALFVMMLKDALEKKGITVKGRTRVIDWKYREVTPIEAAKMVEIAAIDSPPVKDILRETLKPSQNLYAQLLLLAVGAQAQVSNLKPQLTEDAGIEAMNALLEGVGIRKGDVMLEEGSGLSRRNIITPAATVELLKFMSRHRWAEAYRDSLPIAGVDGTLEKRMKDTAASGNVRAKTGTLRYVYTLSGYATTASGERLAFSIMLNNSNTPDRTISPRDDLDAIAVMLATFTGRSR
jgi:D-alanyl-D-alanine carboxypeptidase/D-alanyl-D-alanine-endopeptidase (penicillin-binding protein 4)